VLENKMGLTSREHLLNKNIDTGFLLLLFASKGRWAGRVQEIVLWREIINRSHIIKTKMVCLNIGAL
jgi:hypothetical protein